MTRKLRHPEILHQSVNAAGSSELDAVWPYIIALLDADTPRPSLLAAIGAASRIRPQEAGEIPIDFAASYEEIAEAIRCPGLADDGSKGASPFRNHTPRAAKVNGV
jgi:hypothetical protein